MPQPPPIPEHIQRLRPYVAGKPIEEVRRELGLTEIVKLASNENPDGPSPKALAALRAAAEEVRLYPDGSYHALTQALARRWDVPPECLVVGNGSDEVLHLLALAYLEPGDELLTCEPTFVVYRSNALLNHAEYVTVPCREFRFDLDAMRARLTERTRLVIVCNPNNPTGTLVSDAEVRRLLDAVPERALVVLDEAYHEYVEEPSYPNAWEYVREGRNVVILRTFSKIYALAGLRVGYGLARPEIAAALQRVREPFNVNSMAAAAALASLDDPEQVTRSRAANRAGLAQLAAGWERLGLRHVPSHANFALVDVGRPCKPVFEALLRRGVIVRTGDIFDLPTWLRVSVGTPEQNDRFLAALAEVLAEA